LPLCTKTEGDIFHRAKNAKKSSKSKSASSLEYNRSTGFEAVLGYLYLIGNDARIKELLQKSDERDFKAIAVAGPFKPVHH
jgi:ribonuclease-3 family protein